MAKVQPVSGTGWLKMDVRCSNSDGTQQSDSIMLDQLAQSFSPPRPPMMQDPEFQFNVRGGQVNTITVRLTKGGIAAGINTEAVDCKYEVLKR